MPKRFSRRGIRRPKYSGRAFSNALEKQLQAHEVSLPASPPTLKTTPPVKRWIRISNNYAGASLTYDVTANKTSNADAFYYTGQTGVSRYLHVRFHEVRAWLSITSDGQAGATSGFPQLTLTDPAVGFQTEDFPGPGVDWAKGAIVPCLQSRQSWLSVGSTQAVVTVNADAAAGIVGQLIVDILAEFN